MLKKTHLSPSLNPFRSYRSIIHKPLNDSLVGDGKFKYSIDYQNKKKTSGVITYYHKNVPYGSIAFKNNTIVDVNINDYSSLAKEKYQFDLYFDAQGDLINSLKVDEFTVKRIVPKLILGDKHTALGNLERLQFNYPKATFSFYIDDVYYSSVEMIDNKPYNGVMFEPDYIDTSTYKYRKFKKW